MAKKQNGFVIGAQMERDLRVNKRLHLALRERQSVNKVGKYGQRAHSVTVMLAEKQKSSYSFGD